MSHSNIAHRRTHNLLLVSKLLTQRDHVSPFTLVLDTLEQTATPLLQEYLRRANISATYTIFLGFETIRKPEHVKIFIPCYNKTPTQIASAILESSSASSSKRILIIIDSLHSLCSASVDSRSGLNLVSYLSSFLAPIPSRPTVQTSIVAVYHTDIPLPAPAYQTYQPSPLSLLSYLATTLLTVHSLTTLLSARVAQERSQVAPLYGLAEEKEGIIVGLKPHKFKGNALKADEKGLVLELEHRRKSGRGVHEWYFLPLQLSSTSSSAQTFKETVIILDDHPLFRRSKQDLQSSSSQELSGLTFELGLTDRQKLERDGVVLPYFDAQQGGGLGGPGDGGRILYDMGSEDDFDEEEDEI